MNGRGKTISTEICVKVTPASSCTLTGIPSLVPWEAILNERGLLKLVYIFSPRGAKLDGYSLRISVDLLHCLCFVVLHPSGAHLQQYSPVFSQGHGCAFCIRPMKTCSSKTPQRQHRTTLLSSYRVIISSALYCHVMAQNRPSLALFSGLKCQTPHLVYTKTLTL